MGDKDDDVGNSNLEGATGGAAGGDSPTDASFSAQFQDLNGRLEVMNRRDRRRALLRLSDVYQEDLNSGEFNSGHNGSNQTQVIVRQNDDKLPPFSGAVRINQGEVSFQKWLRAAKRLQADASLSEAQVKRVILKSLRGQADEIGDYYSAENSDKIIDILIAQYGNMLDGEELKIQFYNILQEPSQSASDYLSLLFLKLSEVHSHGGIRVDEMDSLLLRQFLRGCSDEGLMLKLNLTDDNPIPYHNFITLVRREETRRMQRKCRVKARATVQAVMEETSKKEDEVNESMQQKIAKLEEELAELRLCQQNTEHVVEAGQSTVSQQVTFPIFCYRCGQDKHKANFCVNNPNPALVQRKVDQRRKQNSNSKN